MLHLYDNTPVNNANRLSRKSVTDDVIPPTLPLIVSLSRKDKWDEWIGDAPLRSLCVANALNTVQNSTNASESLLGILKAAPVTCDVTTLMCSEPYHEIIRVSCPTIVTAGLATNSSSNVGYIRPSNGVSFLTAVPGTPDGDIKDWIQAIIQPYNMNDLTDSASTAGSESDEIQI